MAAKKRSGHLSYTLLEKNFALSQAKMDKTFDGFLKVALKENKQKPLFLKEPLSLNKKQLDVVFTFPFPSPTFISIDYGKSFYPDDIVGQIRLAQLAPTPDYPPEFEDNSYVKVFPVVPPAGCEFKTESDITPLKKDDKLSTKHFPKHKDLFNVYKISFVNI